jgi:hypothetical protein
MNITSRVSVTEERTDIPVQKATDASAIDPINLGYESKTTVYLPDNERPKRPGQAKAQHRQR